MIMKCAVVLCTTIYSISKLLIEIFYIVFQVLFSLQQTTTPLSVVGVTEHRHVKLRDGNV